MRLRRASHSIEARRKPFLQVAKVYCAARQGKRPVEILLPAKWETNAGVYRFPGPHAVVLRGFVSEWRTVMP